MIYSSNDDGSTIYRLRKKNSRVHQMLLREANPSCGDGKEGRQERPWPEFLDPSSVVSSGEYLCDFHSAASRRDRAVRRLGRGGDTYTSESENTAHPLCCTCMSSRERLNCDCDFDESRVYTRMHLV